MVGVGGRDGDRLGSLAQRSGADLPDPAWGEGPVACFLRIPSESGHPFRREGGHHSDVKAATHSEAKAATHSDVKAATF